MTALVPTAAAAFRPATVLSGVSHIVTGCTVLKDEQSVKEGYGPDLDQLVMGDEVGIQPTSQGELHLWVNGWDYGVAASNLSDEMWTVVDLYGWCVQLTVGGYGLPPPSEREGREEGTNGGAGESDGSR